MLRINGTCSEEFITSESPFSLFVELIIMLSLLLFAFALHRAERNLLANLGLAGTMVAVGRMLKYFTDNNGTAGVYNCGGTVSTELEILGKPTDFVPSCFTCNNSSNYDLNLNDSLFMVVSVAILVILITRGLLLRPPRWL